MSEHTYTCAQCGGAFTATRSDEEAHAEAVRNWGCDGYASGMVVICDDCYQEVMARVDGRLRRRLLRTFRPGSRRSEFEEMVLALLVDRLLYGAWTDTDGFLKPKG